jgi:hypothetical protein
MAFAFTESCISCAYTVALNTVARRKVVIGAILLKFVKVFCSLFPRRMRITYMREAIVYGDFLYKGLSIYGIVLFLVCVAQSSNPDSDVSRWPLRYNKDRLPHMRPA